jgi:cellulose synthase/poly-beta-1,6-N-acetylglucosamine synthase-like glycosyltransferase
VEFSLGLRGRKRKRKVAWQDPAWRTWESILSSSQWLQISFYIVSVLLVRGLRVHHDTDLRFHSTSFLVVSVSVSGLGEPCVATSHLHPSRLALFTQLALHTAIFTRLA